MVKNPLDDLFDTVEGSDNNNGDTYDTCDDSDSQRDCDPSNEEAR